MYLTRVIELSIQNQMLILAMNHCMLKLEVLARLTNLIFAAHELPGFLSAFLDSATMVLASYCWQFRIHRHLQNMAK
jgi:hypothetical protein